MIIGILDASLISSVLGLKVTPRNVIILFLSLLFKILSILFVSVIFLWSLDFTTLFIIERSVLYLSAIAWTIFYDTIYSFQDIEDDKEVGIKSTGILFEANPKRYLAICIVIIILIAGPTFYFLSNGDRFQIFVLTTGVFFFCLHLTFQLLKLDYRNPKNCLATFKSNRTAGLILTGFMIIATLMKL